MLRGPGRRPAVKSSCAFLLGVAAVALTATTADARGGGASVAASTPALDRVACARGCTADGAVERGGRLTLHGRNLQLVRGVVFLGGPGRRDNARVTVRPRSATRLAVAVPATARSGRLALVSAAGTATQRRVPAVTVVARGAGLRLRTAQPTLAAVEGIPQLEAGVATVRAGKAVSAATIAYTSTAPAARSVRVDIVRRADGAAVFSDQRTAQPQQRHTVEWDGRDGDRVALDGRYEVRIAIATASAARDTGQGARVGGATLASAAAPPESVRLATFRFAGAVFPVRGTHDFGSAGARFGAGRGGYRHQGQDVMARCGTPVVAARGGVVKHKARHGAAGNYVVISDPLSGQDHAYMHLRAPARVARGARVQTGQQIGAVGATGRASACHLHFEVWSTPGWYEGGSPIDPLPLLRRWAALG